MNRTVVNRVANAVLYEGYILYPYRPSVKNRQRWTVGGLYPDAYCRATGGSELSSNQTECLVQGDSETRIEIIARFLHLTLRQVCQFASPLEAWPGEGVPPFRAVEAIHIGDRTFCSWQEAEEREVVLGAVALGKIAEQPFKQPFTVSGRRWQEPLISAEGMIPGFLLRTQQSIEGMVELSAKQVSDGLFRVTVNMRNLSPLEDTVGRDDALMRSLVSAHLLLGVQGGIFVSLLDPADDCHEAAANCRNIGLWPVLVGEEGSRDAMLASPIILYDYPQIAPESPGDLFDGTEIDEILTLRILTLTDEEKRQVAAVDERARTLLARSEALGDAELFGLHGTMRPLGAGKGTPHG